MIVFIYVDEHLRASEMFLGIHIYLIGLCVSLVDISQRINNTSTKLMAIFDDFGKGSLVRSSITMDAFDRSEYVTWYHASNFKAEQTDSEISGFYIGQYVVKR